MFEINKNSRRLIEIKKKQYIEEGYIKGLPVFTKNEVNKIQVLFKTLRSRLPENIDINKTNFWNKASKSFYELCHTPAILNYVEDILGENFYLWGGMFFFKKPKSKSIVPWHQDAQYWPLSPSKSVTVWLAVYDTDRENAAMKIVSGSHKEKIYTHKLNKDKNYLLDQEVTEDQIDKSKIVYMNLKAGEISLHTDALLHGSDANNSNRPRCGIVLRFSPTDVKADLSIWPFFSIQLSRGVDNFNLNPIAPKPRGEATPVRIMQFHTDFEKQW